MSRKILFILRKSTKINRYSFGSFGLSNSAAFVVSKLNNIGYEANAVQVVDSNGVDKEVVKYRPDVVIIEALWIPPLKLAELLKLHRKATWIVRIHSKAPFLAMEGIALQWIVSYHHIGRVFNNFYISCNTDSFNNQMRMAKSIDSVYLPNIYFPMHKEFYIPKKPQGNIVDIGCFGAIRPLKNQFLQGIAAMQFAANEDKFVRFHINGTRPEQLGENVRKNLRWLFSNTPHKLVEHDWYGHKEFSTKLIPQMDIGMQVSLTESFNIVTADFIYAGVPIVVSYDVDWMPRFTRVNPNSVEEIAQKLRTMYNTRGPNAVRASQNALKRYNKQATKQWIDVLGSI